MSWLDSISNLSNNISSFTKEVLTEDGEHQSDGECRTDDLPLHDTNAKQLTEEVAYLTSELSSKEQQIHHLEQENARLQQTFEKHCDNLQQHLQEKDSEVNALSERLRNMEADYMGKLEDLTFERDKLTEKLLETTAKDDSWTDEWNDNEDVETLRSEKDSLANELMMKEIVLNSIEQRMSEISGTEMDVADFSVWLDELVEKKSEKSEKIDEDKLIRDFMSCAFQLEDNASVKECEQLLMDVVQYNGNAKKNLSELDAIILDLQNTIRGVEYSIREDKNHPMEDFTIDKFQKWIQSINTSPVIDTSPNDNNALLEEIEREIREFDVDDKYFVIAEFSDWLEKVQTRIDDLEIDLLNEQEIRDSSEAQRNVERAKLEELFAEKQKEIGMLKVELYNNNQNAVQGFNQQNNNFNQQNFPEQTLPTDEGQLERLNELEARCEALKDELTCAQMEATRARNDHSDLTAQLKNYKVKCDESAERFEELSRKYNDEMEQNVHKMKQIEDENNDKVAKIKEQFYSEIVEFEEKVKKLKGENNEMKNNNDKLLSDNVCLKTESEQLSEKLEDLERENDKLDHQCMLMTEKICQQQKEAKEKYEELLNRTKIDEIEQKLQERVQNLENEKDALINELNALKEESDEQLTNKDEIIETMKNEKMVVENKYENVKTLFEATTQQYNVNFQHLTSIRHLFSHEEEDYTQTVSSIKDLLARNAALESKDVENMEKETKQTQEALDVERISTSLFKLFPGYMSDGTPLTEQCLQLITLCDQQNQDQITLHQNYSTVLEKYESLKISVQEKEAAHENQAGNEDAKKEIEELREQVEEQEKEIETLHDEVKKTKSAGSGLKFGALKKRIREMEKERQELKDQIEAMKNENGLEATSNVEMEQLKQQCEEYKNTIKNLNLQLERKNNEFPASGGNAGDKIHQLSLMLTEKSEQLDRSAEECNTLKARLVELENETSDMELIREECQQLKAMLVGREQQSKVNDTISLLQAECKQLKQLLAENDQQYQKLQQENLAQVNELSDMELLREECRQLKLMLTSSQSNEFQDALHEKEMLLEQKDAIIIDLQNSSSNMEFVQEECKQLKRMLLQKETSFSVVPEEQNSFMVQVQQLEEYLAEREAVIREKDLVLLKNEQMLRQKDEDVARFEQQLREKETILEETNERLNQKDRTVSDLQVSNLREECQSLKKMLAERDEAFAELQSEMDGAGVILQLKTDELQRKAELHVEMEQQLQQTVEALQALEQEHEFLKQELNDNMVQEENIHILQTEYRHVEEKLTVAERELNKTQEKLFEAETHVERVQVYEEQYNQLADTLKAKDEELRHLQLQSSESSILESETVTLLQQELNTLKGLVFEREHHTNLLQDTLENKNCELQNLQASCDHDRAALEELENASQVKNYQVKQLSEENSNLSATLKEKDDLCRQLELNLSEMREKQINGKEMIVEAVKQTELNDSQSQEGIVINFPKPESPVEHNLLSKENESLNIEQFFKNVRRILMVEGEDLEEIEKRLMRVVSETEDLQKQRGELLAGNDRLEVQLSDCLEQIGEISNILNESRSEKKRLVEEHEYKLKDLQSQLLEYEELESMYEARQKELDTIENEHSRKMEKMTHEYNELSVKSQNTEASLQQRFQHVGQLQRELAEKREDINKESSNSSPVESQNDSLYEEMMILREQNTAHKEKIQGYVAEVEKLENVFKLEKEKMSLEHVAEKEELNKRFQEQMNSLMQQDNSDESLREELLRNSHSLLQKNSECDVLKMEQLKLEEQVYDLQKNLVEHQQVVKQVEELKQQLQSKDEHLVSQDNTIKRLQMTVEDNEARLENALRERELMKELAQQKANAESEKDRLAFGLHQHAQRVQELEVRLKHKDVEQREVEAKTARELDRLRNHMMMSEESHTKDILELQDKGEALAVELENAKETLKRKAIILHDSSKQFQEHVGTMEDQLTQALSEVDRLNQALDEQRKHSEASETAVFNLQAALEQLQNEKREQYDYLTNTATKQQQQLNEQISHLQQQQQLTKNTVEEASLAVQGITKLNLQLQQKEEELKIKQTKIEDLSVSLHQRNTEIHQLQNSSDAKIDRYLIGNLLWRYFQSAADKRPDILKVVGAMLAWNADEINQLGDGSPPSQGWMSWGFGGGNKKSPRHNIKSNNVDQSFSELFVKFLEHETEGGKVAGASLLQENIHNNVLMSPTPDILAFHNNTHNSPPATPSRIPAPGQEIPRVHTHHAQSALKSMLTPTS